MKNFILLLSCSLLVLGIHAQTPKATMEIIQSGGYLNPLGISPNGKYVTGYYRNGSSFYWNEEAGFHVIDEGQLSSAYCISNNGFIAGQFMDNSIIEGQSFESGGYFKDNQWHSLGTGLDTYYDDQMGSAVRGISSNNSILIGGWKLPDGDFYNSHPCYWELKDGEYELNLLSMEGLSTSGFANIVDGSGKIIGGWIQLTSRVPVLWINGEMKQILLNGSSQTGGVNGISENGKYAAVNINSTPYLYYIEEDKLVEIPVMPGEGRMQAFHVSNEGTVFGQTQGNMMGGIPAGCFVYNEKIGSVKFVDLLNSLGIDISSFDRIDKSVGISADGTRFVINGFGEVLMLAVVTLNKPLGEYARPTDVAATNKLPHVVSISWTAVNEEEATLEGYNIYRNNVKINTELVAGTSFDDQRLENGTYTYQVSAVWNTDKESELSNPVTISNGLLPLPFIETFDSQNFEANFWNTQHASSGWSVTLAGIPAPCLYYVIPPTGTYSEYVISPYLDATGKNELFVSFALSKQNQGAIANNNKLIVELFNGEEWHELATVNGGESPFELYKYNISAYAANKPFIQLRFKLEGENSDNRVLAWYIDNIRIFTPEDEVKLDPPTGLKAVRNADGRVSLSWADPDGYAELSYINVEGGYADFMGATEENTIFANYFSPEDLAAYNGYYLTDISAFLITNFPDNPAKIKLVAFDGEEKILDQQLDTENITFNKYVKYPLTTPLAINASKPLYFGIEISNYQEGDRQLGLSSTDEIDGRSNLYSEDGGKTWHTYKENGIAKSNMIVASVSKELGTTKRDGIMGYYIYRNGEEIAGIILNTLIDDDAPEVSVCYEVAAYYTLPLEYSPLTPKVCAGDFNSIDDPSLEKAVYVYPNPVSDAINIIGEFKSASLFNINGTILIHSIIDKMDVSNISSGIYILKIETGEKTIIEKIVKK